MAQANPKTVRMVQLALLIALLAVLTFTPFGYLVIPPVSITFLHIPVIIGAILLGPPKWGNFGIGIWRDCYDSCDICRGYSGRHDVFSVCEWRTVTITCSMFYSKGIIGSDSRISVFGAA